MYFQVEEAGRKYILTQGPLPNTIVHFWLMVWEQDSKAVIMLNKLVEKNQVRRKPRAVLPAICER